MTEQQLLDDIRQSAHRVDLPDGALAVLQRGSGPPVVLVHGIPLSMITWRHNIDALARTATVLAVDLRGFGMSDKPAGGDYRVVGQAEVLRRLLQELALPSVDIVGSSYGCAVAIVLAHTAPERVRRLVLINPVCYPQGRHSAARLARIGAVSALAGPALRSPALGRRILAGPLRRSYVNPRLATPELVSRHHQLLARNAGDRSFLAALRSLDENDVARRVPELKHQTLVLWGAQDRVLPPTHAERMARELAGVRLELLPEAGHLPHEETPEQVNVLISAFLSGGQGDSISESR